MAWCGTRHVINTNGTEKGKEVNRGRKKKEVTIVREMVYISSKTSGHTRQTYHTS